MTVYRPKYLILARHGTYDESTGELDESGRARIELMARKLKENYLNGLKLKLVHSPIFRIIQTAQIYARILSIPQEEIQKEYRMKGVRDDPKRRVEPKIEEATQALEEALASKNAEAYLFVTHEDTAIEAITLFRRRNFGIEEEIGTMQFACAFLVDLDNPRLLQRLRP